ncbi:NAD(P)-binding domain-containing protein [Sinorhizobium numidicum]|uniref:Pyrroline-5-carboxylate reductase n=1 Tax=Sinorhizobium numidicum TaxID=680248 RepID=A0ABY8CT34_9HYPH|nr:pyrroline-5-carboxylate reductase dimerization domain-containing protein [Sinorhizobium numidicum]WEX78413.1 NAD(P)-binding domain-containing protein [Sinorhizobium numidicum]WEX81809.1 NAD(P)-binding domain-containing protein [Sinorhizobium numidicum]
MSNGLKIGVIGGNGWLGRAIIQSLLDAKLTSPEDLTLSHTGERPARFEGAYWTRDNQQLAGRSNVIVVSVRPADLPALAVDAAGKLLISVMAGIRLDELAVHFRSNRVVRAMPNAAAEVGKSYTPWVASEGVEDRDRFIVRSIFDSCGTTDEVASEGDIDYLTGLSGSGPAFPALLATAMMKDAIAYGLSPDIARRAVNSVLIGAGRLLERRNECPADMVDAFLGYRGTTAAAIEAMGAAGFDAAIAGGLAAALQKSVSMGERS